MFNTLGNSIQRNGLVGEWLLDGNALDTSGNGNNGTATNVTYVKTDRGYQSQAGSFNGSSSYMSTSTSSNNFGTGDFSINIWYYPIGTSTGQSQWIYSKNNNTSAGIRIGRDNFDRIVFFFVNGGGSIACNASYTEIGKWQMFTFTRQGTSIKVLKNGIEIGSSTISSGYNASTSTNGYFGVNYNGTAGFLNGYLQSTRFFNKLLSQDEIQLLYLEGLRKLGPINIAKYPSLLSGLVGYWDMKGTAHNLVDGVAGTVNGATLTQDRFGNSNSAYSFNGSSNYINCNNSSLLNGATSGTFIFYIKRNANGVQHTIINKTQSGVLDYFQIMIDSNNKIRAFIGNQFIYSTGTITDTNWHFIGFTFDGTNGKFYIDGNLDSTQSFTEYVRNTSFEVNIGRNVPSSAYFNGNIDSGFLFNRAISSDEVKLLYDLTSQDYIYPTPSYDLPNLREGLVLDLNEQGYDLSGNGNDGTLVNSPTLVRQGRAKGLSYNGGNQGLTNNTISIPFNEITINVWNKQITAGNDKRIVHIGNVNTEISIIHRSTTQGHYGIIGYINGGTTWFIGHNTTGIPNGTPVMLTLVAGSNYNKLYVNGKQVSLTYNQGSQATGIGNQTLNTYNIGFVSTVYTNTSEFNPRIRNRALSEREVQQLYYSQKANFVY